MVASTNGAKCYNDFPYAPYACVIRKILWEHLCLIIKIDIYWVSYLKIRRAVNFI